MSEKSPEQKLEKSQQKIVAESYSGITGKNSQLYSMLFFIIGLIGAIGFRLVLIINKWSSLVAIIIWYIAIICYIFFYIYRYFIEQKRRQILISSKLKHKLDYNLELSKEDKINMKKIVDSLIVSKQNLNLVILIIISIISLIIQIVLDFIFK